jgi:hypothetical protein
MMLDGAEECQLSGPIGELVPYTPMPLASTSFQRSNATPSAS